MTSQMQPICVVFHGDSVPVDYVPSPALHTAYLYVVLRDTADYEALIEAPSIATFPNVNWDFVAPQKVPVVREIIWPAALDVKSGLLIAFDVRQEITEYAEERGLPYKTFPFPEFGNLPLVVSYIDSAQSAHGVFISRLLPDLPPHMVIGARSDLRQYLDGVKISDCSALFESFLVGESQNNPLGLRDSVIPSIVYSFRREPEKDVGHDPIIAVQKDVAHSFIQSISTIASANGFQVVRVPFTAEMVSAFYQCRSPWDPGEWLDKGG